MTDRELLELLLKKVTGTEEKVIELGDRIKSIEETMATKDDVVDLSYIKRAVRDC